MALPEEFQHELKKISEFRIDTITRLLYSTDASIYQIEPLGVAFPRNGDELAGTVELAARYKVPILARGAGSSLAGQAIGPALILDCSRYMTHIHEINPEERTAVLEPGVVLNAFNRAVSPYGLQFGPDPASAERATIGGSLANNATGAHSIQFGMAADHLIEAEVVLADGSVANFGEISVESLTGSSYFPTLDTEYPVERNKKSSLLTNISDTVLHIRQAYTDEIYTRWPKTWRRASGYSLNYLLPWSPSTPEQWNVFSEQGQLLPYPPVQPGTVNLASLLCGSEGTLAILRKIKVRLVPKPEFSVLGVKAYPGLIEACEAVPGLLDHKPSAIELVPCNLIELAYSSPAYARQLSFVEQFIQNNQIPAALLIIEFSGEDREELTQKAQKLGNDILVAESGELQRQIWAVRKVGLGILLSRKGDRKPTAFIEDLAVPVERLGEFIRGIEEILAQHNTEGEIYAHASAGCLHIRPILSLKTSQGIKDLRSIATQAVQLTLQVGGATSGEHGDGLARSEWLERAYGKAILQAFRELKIAADPDGILNPGKVIDPQPMDQNIRYGPAYHANAWQPVMDFPRSAAPDKRLGLQEAIEQCNGAGVCRKTEGVMCPSFQALQDELHNPRGRANLLRALISGRFPSDKLGEEAVRQALDLCLACKGCKSECPSGVDIAKLKYEFNHHYYRNHRRMIRDYLFGYIGIVAKLGSLFGPLPNWILASSIFTSIGEKYFGLTPNRPFPKFAPKSLSTLLKEHRLLRGASQKEVLEKVLFLSDAFTEFFHPKAGLSAILALKHSDCMVQVLPVFGAGRTLISKGFLTAAKKQVEKLVDAVYRLDPEGQAAIVGVEPSEIYTLRDELKELLPNDLRAVSISERAFMIDEYLIRPGKHGQMRLRNILDSENYKEPIKRQVLFHGHCYQKAQPPIADGFATGVAATLEMLNAGGFQTSLIESSCCGMAGAFGYEGEHYELSMKVGEMSLFPAIRNKSADQWVSASGISCQAQIQDGTGQTVLHPIQLLMQSYKSED